MLPFARFSKKRKVAGVLCDQSAKLFLSKLEGAIGLGREIVSTHIEAGSRRSRRSLSPPASPGTEMNLDSFQFGEFFD